MKLRRARHMMLLAGCLAIATHAAAGISLRVVSKTTLPIESVARDVRWACPAVVYLGLGKKGVIQTRVDAPARFTVVIPAANRGGYPISGRVAVAQKYLVVASPLGGFGWVSTDQTSAAKLGQKGLLTVMDIDARGDVVAVLGADSGDVYGLARDGAIAWTGSLSENMTNMRPFMWGRSKPGGKDMARCSILEAGAIRFMPDGTVVVVPGVEPGVYRYDDRGKLVQTWETGSLGILDNCDISDDDLKIVARDFERRIEWLASRVIVDDVIPLRSGPALLLRRVEGGATKWNLVTLPFKGRMQRVSLPLTLPTPRGHIRGDVRGDQLVLLAFDDPLPRQTPVIPPQLIVLAMNDQ